MEGPTSGAPGRWRTHEIGAAVGVAVLSAVAAARPVTDFAAGYSDAFLVAAGIATALAVAALFALPVVRPQTGSRLALH